MDNALFFSSLLLLAVVVFSLYPLRGHFIPGVIRPFVELDEEERAILQRRKTQLRLSAALLFCLAALSLFSPFPRGITLLLALGGFYFQYRVFRLRRSYPMDSFVRAREDG